VDIQWTETDPKTGERRFVQAVKFARGWRFKTRAKRREDWQRVEWPSRDMWETLLDAIERRYQRREGIDDADVNAVRAILNTWTNGPKADGAIQDEPDATGPGTPSHP
jgi:hypothetical protein